VVEVVKVELARVFVETHTIFEAIHDAELLPTVAVFVVDEDITERARVLLGRGEVDVRE